MNPSPMRKLASSKLFLFSILSFILSFVFKIAYLYFTFQSPETLSDLKALLPNLDANATNELLASAIMISVVMISVLSALVASPLVVGGFLVYSNARSQKPLKTNGFTLIKVYFWLLTLDTCFNFFSVLVSMDGFDYNNFAALLEQGLNLVLVILALQAIKAAQDYARYGFTARRVSGVLPILILISLCVQAGELILMILVNLRITELPGAAYYMVSSPEAFASMVAMELSSLLCLALFYPLVNRLKEAVQAREPAEESQIFLN